MVVHRTVSITSAASAKETRKGRNVDSSISYDAGAALSLSGAAGAGQSCSMVP